MPPPRQQELPFCHRHPDRLCPGDCQYRLPSDECIHELQGRLDASRQIELGYPSDTRQRGKRGKRA